MYFYPLTRIDEGFHPRCDLVFVNAVGRIVGIVPGEAGTFQVRHHSQMASVLTGDTCYAIV